jgi:hypothetical protein
MSLRLGQRFWPTQADMLRHAKNAQVLIKYDRFEFSFFDSIDRFLAWFEKYQMDCSDNQRAFAIYEILSTGRDMCFACDIEVYCPLGMSESSFQKTQHSLVAPGSMVLWFHGSMVLWFYDPNVPERKEH